MDLLEQQLQQLQKAQKTTTYPSLQDRKNLLLSLKIALQNEACTIAAAVSKDFSHRSEEETLFCEIYTVINAINYINSRLKGWMKKRKRHVSWQFLPAYAFQIPQPLGVIGIMVPWNYPIFLSLLPAVYALASGNRVMIKMSELSVQTGIALKSLIENIGLEKHLLVVNGDVELAKQFAALPFDHLLFTGSTKVGKQIMKAASENLTPVTLELGGKSPAILSKTMHTKYFNRLFMGKMFNSAQTCIAPDYLLIPADWSSVVEQEFKKLLDIHYPDLMNNEQYSSIISTAHKERLLSLVQDAKDKGARVVECGATKTQGNKLPLYLVFDVTTDMAIMKEELFGPILPVLTYESMNKAIEFINDLPHPLALYYFGEDKAEIELIQYHTLSGALTINDTMMHAAIDDLPFGGVGASGMGRYHGQEGFDTFSQLKPVMVQRSLSPVVLMYPPYGKFLRWFLTWVGGIKLKKRT